MKRFTLSAVWSVEKPVVAGRLRRSSSFISISLGDSAEGHAPMMPDRRIATTNSHTLQLNQLL